MDKDIGMGELCTKKELKRHMCCANQVVINRVMQAHVDMNIHKIDWVLKSYRVLNGYFESLKSEPSKAFLFWGRRYQKPSVEGLDIYLAVGQSFDKQWGGVEVNDYRLHAATCELLETVLYRVKTNMD